MKLKVVSPRSLILGLLLGLLSTAPKAIAQSNLALRVMAANITSGNGSYQAAGINIFKGLKPDVVAIQEFKYGGSSATEISNFVYTTFGSSFVYFRESGYSIPNGVISRWPILTNGSWDDPEVNDRGVAWAQIDLPGTNDLYVVSVHMFNGGTATERNNEAVAVRSNIFRFFPTNAWVVVAGDCNTDDRFEAAISTYKTFLSDSPVPTDLVFGGDADTNEPRNKDYDYVLPSFSLTNLQVPVVVGSQSFSNGLVFDSTVFANNYTLAGVDYVDAGDSHVSGMQHMPVVKDFLIPVSDGVNTNPPSITTPPLNQTNAIGGNVTFSVVASGATPLAYQWRLYNTNLSGATTASLALTNILPVNAGDYTVVVTNAFGSITSVVAKLTVNAAPYINTPPQNLLVNAGANAAFSVIAIGGTPLFYQWRLGGTDIANATNSVYTRSNAQPADAGNYSVVVSNYAGSVTSSVAALVVYEPQTGTPTTLAGWDVSGQSSFGASPLSPSTNAGNLAIVGITRGTGVLTPGGAAARGWGGTSWDSASAAAAVTAGDYATVSLAANAGYKVSFSAISKFDYRHSGTGPTSGVLQYQIGAGSFTDITTLSYSSSASSGASLSAVDLSGINALQNVTANNVVTFRIVNYGASAPGGTWYIFDVGNNTAPDFAISGIISSVSTNNPPAQTPVLSDTLLSGDQFQFQLTGTVGSNYVVQATTNLSGGTWQPVRTNAAPFVFVETNALNWPHRFYRGQIAP